jgi:hypothetical protein
VAKSDVRVVTHGIPELQRALKRLGNGAEKELKSEFKDIAEDVAADVRPKVPSISGRAASSVKGRGTSRGGSIAFGGSAAPHYPWLDFGGRVGRNRSIERPFVPEGRYLYPTIREKRPELIRRTDEVIERLAKKAGFTTHG